MDPVIKQKTSAVRQTLLGERKRPRNFWSRFSFNSVFLLIGRYFFSLSLIGLTLLLAYLNHVPNTWLTGWDTLHPEFDLGLNFKRALLGTFRLDQGLGAVAAHAHMVELPRIILLWFMSWVMPVYLLRYAYVTICLVLGPLGIYFLVAYLLKKARFSSDLTNWVAWGSGLWYLFNLGTVQHFILPFEMFPTNYAANGWLFYCAAKYLEERKRSQLVFLAVVNFFASNLAYSFISWYVYFFSLIGFLSSVQIFAWMQKRRIEIKPSLVILGVILAVNLYWLLPNLYFVINHAWHIPLGKNNQLVSEEIYHHNKEYGTIQDTIAMKNHLFSWKIKDGDKFPLIFQEYQVYLADWKATVPYILFGVILVGATQSLLSIFKKKQTSLVDGFLPLLLGSFLAFLLINPPLELLIAPLRDTIMIFREGMRNPFIKFNLLLMLSYAVFFGYGLAIIVQVLERFTQQRFMTRATVLLMILVLTVTLGWPFFSGHLIDRRVQLQIPQEYFQLFSWFKHKPTKYRVLILPLTNFWAWDYYSWGYQGAGFMWFGLPQPLFSRDSDRWSPYNEETYRELKYAISTHNRSLFLQLLEKYQIGWIVFDKTVMTNGEDRKALDLPFINEILSSDDFAKQNFSNVLSVHEVRSVMASRGENKANLVPAFSVEPAYLWHYLDSAFTNFGHYATVTDTGNSNGNNIDNLLYFPARDILTQDDRVDTKRLSWDGSSISLKMEKAGELTYSLSDVPIVSAKIIVRQNELNQKELQIIPLLPTTATSETSVGPSKIISVALPSQAQAPGSVSINGQVLRVEQTNEFNHEIGMVDVFVSQPNTIKWYNDANETVFDQLPGFMPESAFNCSTGEEQLPGASKDDGLNFVIEDKPICVSSPLVSGAQQQRSSARGATDSAVLVKANLGFKTSTQSPGEVCLFNVQESETDCSNEQTIFSVNTSANDNEQLTASAQFSVELPADKLRSYQWMLSGTQIYPSYPQIQRIAYTRLSARFVYPSVETTFVLGAIKPDSQSLTKNDVVKLPPIGEPTTVTFAQLNRNPDRCGSGEKATVSRTVERKGTTSFVEYSARYGQSCDLIMLDRLSQNLGYLVSITARNVEGLPLRVCIKNLSNGHCELYVALSERHRGQLITETFLLPPSGDERGYSVHITDFAPGRQQSINDIETMTLVPFSFELLNSLQLVAGEGTLDTQQYLLHSASYEPGWMGMMVGENGAQLLGKPVLIDNWATGWQLNDQTAAALRSGQTQPIIFFWPNILELFGFVMAILVLLLVFI